MSNYQQPGVTVRELVSPTFAAPITGAETVVGIVGPSRGYEEVVEVVTLTDNTPVALSRTNPQLSTLVVQDARDPSVAPFVETNVSNGERDYTLDSDAETGVTTIERSMQTSIANGEQVVTYFENSDTPVQADAHSHLVTLNRLTAASIGANRSEDTEADSLVVQSRGLVPEDDFAVAGEGTDTVTIVRDAGATLLGEFQTVYLTYNIVEGDTYTDQAVKLNGTTAVALPEFAENVVVRNAPGLTGATTAQVYTESVSGTDEDYIVVGEGADTTIARAAGSTTMGVAAGALQVRLSYRAIPDNYWEPTRLTSAADTERKFGPAFDQNGAINSPLTFAASLAFLNGANEVVCQALFNPSGSTPSAPSSNDSTEWAATLAKLRARPDVNVIVPIVSTSGLTTSDNNITSILNTVANHIAYMANRGEGVAALCGGDSTVAGQSSQSTLRAQAESLDNERIALISPGAFHFINFQNTLMQIGGQYVAAAAAGAMARHGVGATLTRKSLAGIAGVVEIKEDGDKNDDAASGLMVVHVNRLGAVEVRHGRTTNTSSAATAELNVVRAKLYMMESLRTAIDTRVIGKITADGRAPLAVTTVVSSVLENLVNRGIITTYLGVQSRLSDSNPTQVECRFAYRPAFALNNVSVEFNIDLATGTTSGV